MGVRQFVAATIATSWVHVMGVRQFVEGHFGVTSTRPALAFIDVNSLRGRQLMGVTWRLTSVCALPVTASCWAAGALACWPGGNAGPCQTHGPMWLRDVESHELLYASFL